MIPIYRAKRLDGQGYITGYLTTNIGTDEFFIEGHLEDSTSIFVFKIDPSTLAIHFHGKWFTMTRLNEIMVNKVVCKVCNDTGMNHGVQKKPNKWSSEPCEFCEVTCIYEGDK